jgi:hypothetical protein
LKSFELEDEEDDSQQLVSRKNIPSDFNMLF